MSRSIGVFAIALFVIAQVASRADESHWRTRQTLLLDTGAAQSCLDLATATAASRSSAATRR